MNMFKQIQQAAALRSKMKKMQKELESVVFETKSNNGKITISARGDATIKDIVFDPSAFENLDVDRLQKSLVMTVNAALNGAKKAASAKMQSLSGMEGLLELMGKG